MRPGLSLRDRVSALPTRPVTTPALEQCLVELKERFSPEGNARAMAELEGMRAGDLKWQLRNLRRRAA